MKIDVKVTNFGKIKEANIQIRPFTVIAGKNSSGKSFLTKAIYSFFRTINKDIVTIEVMKNIIAINNDLTYCLYAIRLSIQETQAVEATILAGLQLRETAEYIYEQSTFSSQLDRSPQLLEKTQELKDHIDLFVSLSSKKKKYDKIKNAIENLLFRIKQLEQILTKPTDLYAHKIQSEFSNSLKENFQTTSLTQLKNFSADTNSHPEFDFSEIGTIRLLGENVNFKLWPNGIDKLQLLSNIVYLESPLYWRLKEPLERTNEFRHFKFISRLKKQELLSGVPQYFYDLLDLLQERVKQNTAKCTFSSIKDQINHSIGGEIIVNKTGEITYKDKESGSEINLYATATGIVNLGIIGLLLERNVISTGSFIIIDEPEVNLHPAWQKVLVEALYELSKNGINVIIATHSIDIMKCIECIVDELDPDLSKDHFGINQLTADGRSHDVSDSPIYRIAQISEDLGESFYKMQMGI